ncbi:MAG: YlbF family regulator [Alicyclobacillaceae bacterium]|nr:YlbF family regulator [Alicyclobacillaceae bacterium]
MPLDPNELWAQAYELGLLISRSPEVEAYHQAEIALHNHPEARHLINRLREQQEQLENLRRYGSGDHLRPLEESIDEILKKLDEIPEVLAFKEAQQRVDALLQEVTRTITSALSEQLDHGGQSGERLSGG